MKRWDPPFELSVGQVAKIIRKTYRQTKWMLERGAFGVCRKTGSRGHYRIPSDQVQKLFPEAWNIYVFDEMNRT